MLSLLFAGSVLAWMIRAHVADAERNARFASLTEREHEVMLRVAAGKLNKIIADELHVSMCTVEVHRARVFAKLGRPSVAEVATQAAAWGHGIASKSGVAC